MLWHKTNIYFQWLRSLHSCPPLCIRYAHLVSNAALVPSPLLGSNLIQYTVMSRWSWLFSSGAASAKSLGSYCCNEDRFIQSYGGWPSLQEHHYPASFTYWLCFVVLSMRFDYVCDLAQGSCWECVKAWSPLCNPVWFVMFPFLSLLFAGSWKQHKNITSSMESAMSKGSLYARTSDYIEGESPHLPKELDHSLGIAREEVLQIFSVLSWVTNHLYFSMSPLTFWHFCQSPQVVTKEKEVLEWKMKYEDSRQEVVEMR